VPLAKLVDYAVVLEELSKLDRLGQAESLAWAAVETIATRHAPSGALTVAGPFLLAVGNSAELRGQVAELYRSAYSDCDGLDALLSESGIEGGRPVRRALRTLDLCLALNEGDFLSARDDDGAARVDEIDRSAWEFTIAVGKGEETLGAVRLADRYHRASPTDFAVMRHFAREDLVTRLRKKPVSVLVDLCGPRNRKITSQELESLLVPELIDSGEWKQWWTRVRNALKQHPNFELNGRSPYVITYHTEAVRPEDHLLADLRKLRDPPAGWDLVEKYVRECKARKQPPSDQVLRECYDHFRERAGKLTEERASRAQLLWLIAARVGELGGIDGALDGAVNFLEVSPGRIAALGDFTYSDILMDVACRCIVEARPDDWEEQLLTLLPSLPLAVCDQVSVRLVDAGKTRVDFEPAIQQILASPIDHFEALLWLWGGPSREADIVANLVPITILMRIVRALDDARRSEKIGRERIKQMNARARSVLPARKYERFARCLDGLEPGMAAALRTQLSRADALGRAVREDMLRALSARFPAHEAEAEIARWSQEDVIYVTSAGLQRKQAEIDEHVNVKMTENARAIGRAAARGDLSENSEYKFALEERDLLRARLAQMNDEVQRAEIISPADVPTDHIGIGTKAVFERVSDKERFEMSFVGSWEADAENGSFNYKAPLPQRLMGKCIGDVVEFDLADAAGDYKLVELLNALE
ncbi:MAG: GreA/GreB family elongation factor, partial [Planctomycetota bacterium]